MEKPVVVVVDGIISSGKTTYLSMLIKLLTRRGWRVTLVKEPVEKWNEPSPSGGPSLFQLFNKNPTRWGYHFQTKAFYDRVMENKEMFSKYGKTSDVFILERSCFTDGLFMSSLCDSKLVTDLEMRDYEDWCKMWAEVMPYEPDLFVYLRPPVEICMERLKERNRPGEENITKEYQISLQNKHDEFFSADSVCISGSHFVPCVRLDTSENYRDDEKIQEKYATHFECLINLIKKSRIN
jgi:deoxyadenosine/deoxycytidine kinase